MRFQSEGEFSTCLNQDYPDSNNFRDSWGVSYGNSLYQCGDISVKGFLGNPQELKVLSSVGYVIFDRDGYSSDFKKRNFCKKNNCFEESSHISKWKHWDSQTIIEFKYIMRNVFEGCNEVTF
jgi:hypothetical protein